jgi:hypothetical protein
MANTELLRSVPHWSATASHFRSDNLRELLGTSPTVRHMRVLGIPKEVGDFIKQETSINMPTYNMKIAGVSCNM